MKLIEHPIISMQTDLVQGILHETVKNQRQREYQKQPENKIITFKGTFIPVDFSAETLQSRKEWNDIFKVLKTLPDRNTPSTKVILQKWRGNFPDKQKLREFLTTTSALQEMLKGIQAKMKKYQLVT